MQQTLTTPQDGYSTKVKRYNEFENLRQQLDELCIRLAANFNLYERSGKPRKAFIIDVLARNTCYGCIINEFNQANKHEDADAIYLENHQLAVNLLIETLREQLEPLLSIDINSEVTGDYGRTDIEIKSCSGGVLINSRDKIIIVEVKTGAGISYHQAFRYLFEKPNSSLIIWRVAKRQIITMSGAELHWLLICWLKIILHRGMQILSKPFSCNHTASKKTTIIKNPQKVVTEFLTGLEFTLPPIVDEIKRLLNQAPNF